MLSRFLTRSLNLNLISRRCFTNTSHPCMPRIMDVDIYSDIEKPQHLIDGYHGGIEEQGIGGGFTVNNAEMTGSILCHSDGVFLWNVTSIEEVSLKTLIACQLMNPLPDVILIGSGQTATLPPPLHWKSIKEWASNNSIGLEIMDSPSACSTFNILTQEDRNVVAALVAIDANDRNATRSMVPMMGHERAERFYGVGETEEEAEEETKRLE